VSDDLDGDDLLAAGVKPSPLARRALSDVRRARIAKLRDDLLASGASKALDSVLVQDPSLRP
jgi:hypothetical protein